MMNSDKGKKPSTSNTRKRLNETISSDKPGTSNTRDLTFAEPKASTRKKLNETISSDKPGTSNTRDFKFAEPKANTRKKLTKTVSMATPNTTKNITSPSSVAPSTARNVKKPTDDEKLDITLAYNYYLQSCMRRLLIEEDLKKKKQVLDGQIHHYEGVLSEKESTLKEIVEDTRRIENQQKIADAVHQFETVTIKIKKLYETSHIHVHLETFRNILQEHCQKLFFKNVKPIQTQEDFDKLMEVMQTLIATMDKFVNSGKDFESVHRYAEAIREFTENKKKSDAAKKEAFLLEKEAVCKVVSTLSDIFAKKYERVAEP